MKPFLFQVFKSSDSTFKTEELPRGGEGVKGEGWRKGMERGGEGRGGEGRKIKNLSLDPYTPLSKLKKIKKPTPRP